jgi:ABC-type multidrug transport system ATPase subunit
LISILTGLYESSAGFSSIAGYDVKTETSEVYKCVGICPQFDIQWEELTIGEHLYFYARLKGIKPKDETRAVKQALQSVSLLSFENRLTKGLSGGEKRRLSIAIALLGNPSVVFLVQFKLTFRMNQQLV